MIYLIILFILIFIINVYVYNKNINHKHLFWDKQKVSRNLKTLGIINKNKLYPIHHNNLSIIKGTINELFIDFINSNYLEGYIYNKYFLDWNLSNSLILFLKKQKYLVGSITSKPINLNVYQINKQFGYVDYLSVKKSLRNKNLAPVLISNLISKYPDNYSFIFKKESIPLPFNYICKFNYYLYNLKFHHKKKLLTDFKLWNINKIVDIFNRYTSYSKKFKIAIQFNNIEEFKRIYYPKKNIIFSYYLKKNNILNLFSFYINHLKINNKLCKVIEILFIIGNKDINNDVFEFICSFCLNNNIDYIYISDINHNNKYIDLTKFIKGKICYIHLYNFNLKEILTKNDIFLPIP